MQILNFTPHRELRLIGNDGSHLTLASAGVARCDEVYTRINPLAGETQVETATVRYGPVQGLPEPRARVAYLVSQLVVQRLPHRTDLYFPARLERNKDGDIIGFRYLGRLENDNA